MKKHAKEQALEALLNCLSEVPFLKVPASFRAREKEINLPFHVEVYGKAKRIIAEVKQTGQPRVVREVVNQMKQYRASQPDVYPVFIAPYISPEAGELCANEQIGFIDLAGNCRICFDRVYISKEGKKNPLAQRRDLRSLYSPRAERVLRVLLAQPAQAWKVQPLAAEAKVSVGQVANVKKLLADREWINAGENGFYLSQPEKLLSEWGQNYQGQRNQSTDYYSLRPIAEIERALANLCERQQIPYALAGFSAAARYAPMVRYHRAMAYVTQDINRVARALDLKSVQSGANVSLIAPYDDGVLYGLEEVGGAKATSPIQAYLDLRQIKARGEEAAGFLRDQIIEARWQVKA